MTDPRGPIDPDDAAAQTDALRALARRLVRDGGAAEDVAQEAWLVALEGARRGDVPLAWWLRGVARNVARHFRRAATTRTRHETAAARPQAFVPDESPVERADVHRRLLAAVLALDEPYRTTVLLRYVDGLSSAEIARKDGVPQGTVRSRLKRGLDTLRERLDAGATGGRREWAVAVAPFGFAGGGSAAPGVLAPVSAGAVAAAVLAGALLVAGAVGAATLGEPDGGIGAPGASPAAVLGDTAPGVATGTAGPATAATRLARERAARPVDHDAADAPEPAEDEAGTLFQGVVRGPDGQPAAGARVRLFVRRPTATPLAAVDPARTTETDASGAFTMPALPLADASDPDAATFVIAESGDALGVQAIRPGQPLTLLLQPTVPRRFRVVDAVDTPIPAAFASLSLEVDDGPMVRVADADPGGWIAVRAAATRNSIFVVAAPGFSPACVEGRETPARVELQRAFRLAGRVVDAAGKPVAGARVTCDGATLVTPDGRFAFEGLRASEWSDWRNVYASAEGYGPAELGVSNGEDLVLQLFRPRDFRFLVRREDGTAVAGAAVSFGSLGGTSGPDGACVFPRVSLAAGQDEIRVGATWIEPGARGPVPGLACERDVGIVPGETPVDIALELHPPEVSYLPVLVVDADGAPCRGVSIAGRFPEDHRWYETPQPTGADGRTDIVYRSPPGSSVHIRGYCRVPRGAPESRTPSVDAVTRPAPGGEPVTLAISPITRIVFEVTDGEGRPLPPSVPVTLKPDHPGPVPDAADSRVLLMEAGEDVAVAVASPGLAAARVRVRSPLSGTLRVPVRLERACTVRGRVVDAAGTPCPGVRIGLRPGGGRSHENDWPDWLDATTRAEDGTFSLDGVPPGLVRVLAFRRDDAVEAAAELTLAPGECRDVGNLVLAGLVWVRGVVRDEAGRPAGRVEIRLVEAEPTGDREADDLGPGAFSAADGRFELALPAGTRGLLVARREGSGTAAVPLDVGRGRDGVVLRLTAEARLCVAVERREYPPARYFRAYVTAGAAAVWETQRVGWRSPREVLEGGWSVYRYDVRALPTGAVRLLLADSDRRVPLDMVLVAGENPEVRVRAE